MELVIQVDEPLNHLHPFITKSGGQTQALTVGSDTSGGQGRETQVSDSSWKLGGKGSRTVCEDGWSHGLFRGQARQLKQTAVPKVR